MEHLKYNGYESNPEFYKKHRPDYPAELLQYLIELPEQRQLLWDCGTGNGQSAVPMADHFEKVVATDVSPAQLEAAQTKDNIEYIVGAETAPFLEEASVDMITVATAIHWLNNDLFFPEAHRVLKPGGILAVWGYSGIHVHPDLNSLLQHLVDEVLAPYISPHLRIAYDRYQAIQFPYKKEPVPQFSVSRECTLTDVQNYLLSWYPCLRYQELYGKSALPLFEKDLADVWGDENSERTLTWDLELFVGKKANH